MTDKVVINRITAGPSEVAYYYGVILFEGNNARMDGDWTSYLYYDYEQNIIASLGEPDRTDYANLVQVKRGMVEDITDEANVLVTEDDIEYYYGAISYAGGTESFEASSNTYAFDLLLDSGHNIDWKDVKVMIGGKADNVGVNLVELTGEYGTYEIKDYLFESSLGIGLDNVKVLHCTINLFNGNKDYYPISFVNKEDLSGSFGVTREAFTTYYIELKGVDFSEATGMVKVKGTSNVNPEAFAYYQNSSMMVYDNKDGSAYMVVNNSSIYSTEIAGPHFAVLGQNLSNFSLTSGYYAASNLSAMTIEVKKNGDMISTIGVKENLLEENRYELGNEMVMMFGGGNGGYNFTKTEGDYKFYVFVNTDQTFDG